MAEPLPRSDASVILTRPEAGSKRFAEALRIAGVSQQIVISPLLRIETCDQPVSYDGIAAVIFTSARAVEAVPPAALRAWCVGDHTADRAVQCGWQAIAAGGTVETLLSHIRDENPAGKLLHLRGEHSRGDLVARLNAAGLTATEQVVYRQRAQTLTAEAQALLAGGTPVVLPVFSPRTAGLLAAAGPFEAPLHLIAMSDAVAAELGSLKRETLHVAAAPTGKAMLTAVKAALGTL